jgi:hypothetical protein
MAARTNRVLVKESRSSPLAKLKLAIDICRAYYCERPALPRSSEQSPLSVATNQLIDAYGDIGQDLP